MNLITLILIFASILVIISTNPVHAVLFLILTFTIASLILIILEIEFIAMLFLIVYIGAIIILFLFVVMMVNIKIIELKEKILRYLPIATFIIFIFFIEILYLGKLSIMFNINSYNMFHMNQYYENLIKLDFYLLSDTCDNIQILSFNLYDKFLFLFLIAGIILLVAMIGAITLTLNQKFSPIKQSIFEQIQKKIINSIRINYGVNR